MALVEGEAVLRAARTRSGEEVVVLATRGGVSLHVLVQGAGFVPYALRHGPMQIGPRIEAGPG